MSGITNVGTQGVARSTRKRQILTVATTEFGKYGYAGTSLVSIATNAGISKTLVVAYFGTKAQLYALCVTEVGERLTSLISAVVDTGNNDSGRGPVSTLNAIFLDLAEQPHSWELIYDPTVPEELAATNQLYIARMMEFAKFGAAVVIGEQGDQTDIEILGNAWVGVLHSCIRWYLEQTQISAEEMAQRTSKILQTLIGLSLDT